MTGLYFHLSAEYQLIQNDCIDYLKPDNEYDRILALLLKAIANSKVLLEEGKIAELTQELVAITNTTKILEKLQN